MSDPTLLQALSETTLSDKPLLDEIEEELAKVIGKVSDKNFGKQGNLTVKFSVKQQDDGSVRVWGEISGKKIPARLRGGIEVLFEDGNVHVQQVLPFQAGGTEPNTPQPGSVN